MGRMMGRPNILLVMVDQLSALALRQYGGQVVKTPNIDALADHGTVFSNNYCNFPICAPSRFSMLTGRLASRFGAYDSGHEFAASNPTMMHYLRQLGYQTCLSGKMHFIGPDQLHGFEERLNTDIYPTRFSWIADWDRANSDGDGGALKGHQTLDDRVRSGGKVIRTLQMDYDEETDFLAHQKLYDLARDRSRPFFMTVSYSHPHDPFEAADPYWSLYDRTEIDMPKVPRMDPKTCDAHSARLMRMYGAEHDILTDEEILRARHAYYANISYIDAKLGGLMDTLRATGLDNDTIVIFTSDHGEMLGERGLWFKFNFFEWSMRVPLIIRLPGAKGGGRRVAGQSSLVDLLPTVLDLATDGIAPDPVVPLDGVSLVPALTGTGAARNVTLAEYHAEGSLAPQFMVRQGNLKLIYSRGDAPLLFDLSNDPQELINLAAGTGHQADMGQLMNIIHDNWPVDTLEDSILISQRKHRFLRDALGNGTPVQWDYAPDYRADQRYVRTKPGIDKADRRLPRHHDMKDLEQ
jgi:choline-sulfatase